MNLNQYTCETNKYITDYIKFADAKAATLLTFLGIALGGIFSLVKFSLSKASEGVLDNYKVPIFILVGFALTITLIFAFLSIFSIFKTIQPNTKKKTNSLNSFPHISTYSTADEYFKQINSLVEAGVMKEYSKHNWELSNICMDKYAALSDAIRNFKCFISLSVIIFLLSSIILFMSYVL